MGVFHVFLVVQMVPNRAKHHISNVHECCSSAFTAVNSEQVFNHMLTI